MEANWERESVGGGILEPVSEWLKNLKSGNENLVGIEGELIEKKSKQGTDGCIGVILKGKKGGQARGFVG